MRAVRAVRAVVYGPLGGAHRADQGMGRSGRASNERRDRLAQPLSLGDRLELMLSRAGFLDNSAFILNWSGRRLKFAFTQSLNRVARM